VPPPPPPNPQRPTTTTPTSLSSRYSAPTHTYPLSLHDALPISDDAGRFGGDVPRGAEPGAAGRLRGNEDLPAAQWRAGGGRRPRSEEHTSELQSREKLVCRLLLEKKNASCGYASSN